MIKIFCAFILFFTLSLVSFASGELESISLTERLKFFALLVPAAIGDSINPCAFAVMFILLSSILKKQKNRKKVIFAGFLFTLAIFISYVAMGFGFYKALANSSNIFYLKLIVGIFGILVGIANLKDYFFYGKFFKMEVPNSWRPKMKILLEKATSPLGVFLVGLIISLFLLPCTSGPYLVILGYLSSESSIINLWGYIYILIYNIIFIIPMIIITFIIGFSIKDIAELKEYKELNNHRMHLIIGIIMLILGAYILFEIF